MYKVVVKQENVFYISDKIVGNDEAAIKEIAEEKPCAKTVSGVTGTGRKGANRC